MHGLINRAIECFVRDCYGAATWATVARQAGLDGAGFESMLHYEDAMTEAVLSAASTTLGVSRDTILEDIGTYLVSHPNTESLRRLLRFGGDTFVEFLHSLDDLPARARLAVEDLDLPVLELREHAPNLFSLRCSYARAGFGHVLLGMLRTLADDYGALVFLNHRGGGQGVEVVEITLIETAFARGRAFELGARAI